MKYIILTLVLIFAPLAFAVAQVNLTPFTEGATVDLEPAFPEPHQTFTASLNDYSLTNGVSSITWVVDGTTLSENTNQRSITLMAKAAGEQTTIQARLSLVGGGTQQVSVTIKPLYVDIIVEPQTKTPAFYLGRALPSVGSIVNLTALISGNSTSETNLLYRWEMGGEVIGGGQMRGENKVPVTIPIGQQSLVTLTISTLDGNLLVEKTIPIRSVTPEVYFYEKNSLYGLSKRPITNLNLVGNSVTIKAEPYNLDINTYNNPDLTEWQIDGNQTTNLSGNPYEITLARPEENFTGTSKVEFHVRNLSQLLQGAKGNFQINF